MTINSNKIIQEIKEKAMTFIEEIIGEQAERMNACETEKMILSSMLSLGRDYLRLYYQTQSNQYDQPTAYNAEGVELPFHSQKKRQQLSLFGKVEIERAYYYRSGERGHSPLDEAINLPPTIYSDAVQELYAELAVEQSYQSCNRFLKRWLNLSISSRAVQQVVTKSGENVVSFYEQCPPPVAKEQEAILVVQADGKGVPQIISTEAHQAVRMKRGQAKSRKKEAIVTTVYTIGARPRTTQEVIASLFHESTVQTEAKKKGTSTKPVDKQIWATLQGKEVAISRLQEIVTARDDSKVQHRVALCDGAKPLQDRFATKFPDFRLMLDFIHAYEYLWQGANLLLGEDDPLRLDWVKTQTTHLLNSDTGLVIEHLREERPDLSSTRREKLLKIANYFERNTPYMDYATCLSLGLPIASGVIEGACRHIVKDRMELSGMRWSQNGAETLLQLRCVRHNEHWDQFWHYHRQLRHKALRASTRDKLPLAV